MRKVPDSCGAMLLIPSRPSVSRFYMKAGLMVGTDSNHVVDVVLSSDGNDPDEDLTPSNIIHYVDPPDQRQMLRRNFTFALTDAALPIPAIQIGLHATCQAYAFTQGLWLPNRCYCKVCVSPRFTRKRACLMSDSRHAATLFLDWDIGSTRRS